MAVVALLSSCLAGSLSAQAPEVHYWQQGTVPPGAIGSLQLRRGGPLPGYFQPVQIRAPGGILISLAEAGQFTEAQPAPLTAGMLIGQVYRFRVMNIPLHSGIEVFPTIEVIDRLYTPRGQERRFPIVVRLTPEDLLLAMDGKFVTHVIYLEDPQRAVPARQDPTGRQWFEAPAGEDPLAVADILGRPVAILRLGARLPDADTGPDMDFLFGCPPLVRYSARADGPTQPPEEVPAQPAGYDPSA